MSIARPSMHRPKAPLRILAVDDDEVDRELIERALGRVEFPAECRFARDGVEALELMRAGDESERPALVLLDLNMPRLDGHGFLRELRADAELRRTVVFVLTTSDFEDDQRLAYEQGIAGYIVKSSAGRGMRDLVRFLESYWSLVSLPA